MLSEVKRIKNIHNDYKIDCYFIFVKKQILLIKEIYLFRLEQII